MCPSSFVYNTKTPTTLRNSSSKDNCIFLPVYLIFFLLSIHCVSSNSTVEVPTTNEATTTTEFLTTSDSLNSTTTTQPLTTLASLDTTTTESLTTSDSLNSTTTTQPLTTFASLDTTTTESLTTSDSLNSTTTTQPLTTLASLDTTTTESLTTSDSLNSTTTTQPLTTLASLDTTTIESLTTSDSLNSTTTTQPLTTLASLDTTTIQSLTTSDSLNSTTTTQPLTTLASLDTTTTESLTTSDSLNSTTLSRLTSTPIKTTKASYLTTTASSVVTSNPKTNPTTPSQNKTIETYLTGITNNVTDIKNAFEKIQNKLGNSSTSDQRKVSERVSDEILNLTNNLKDENLTTVDWINIAKSSIHLNSNVNEKGLKSALNSMFLMTTEKILDLQPPETKFYLEYKNVDMAGIKSTPDNLKGFELQTTDGDVIVPADMTESDSSVLFKIICYKNDMISNSNKSQFSPVYISMVDAQNNNPLPQNDPDKRYSVVLKSKNATRIFWEDVKEKTNGIFGFQVPLTKNGLTLIEFSSLNIEMWGKMNEIPSRYDYHLYYATRKDNKNIETVVKVKNIKIEKYNQILRVLVQSYDPHNIIYFRVNSQESQRLNKRSAPAQLMTRSSTIQPLVKKIKSTSKYEAVNLQDTSIDENYNVILKTNLFGTFTCVISFITPQSLDFAKIFVDFDKKVMNNPYVLIVLLLIFLIYCILAVFVRRLDKKDQISWLYLPLSDNVPSDSYQYLIRVHTGVRSSRIMSATPYFILRGMTGKTNIRILSDGVRKNLGAGTVSDYLLRTYKNLGNLLNLKIWHNNEGTNPRWFLSNINIKDVANNTWYSFPCNDWLSFDKGDGSIIRQLEPHSNQFNNLITNIKSRIHIGLFDDHLYFSIVKRPRSSHFTRLQRLSTLVAVLYLSLISSAMYYKPNDKIPSRAFTLGPFTLTSKEIVVGIISSIIMVLPTSIIINLFKWRKVKGEGSDTCGRSLTIGEWLKQFRLPWWSVYLAYGLVFLSISVSAFFTFMYSIVWGKELALQWLLSVIINVTGSVILIQPVKIITIALLTSCVLKSPQQDYEHSKKYISENEDLPQSNIEICEPPNMSKNTWKKKKRTMKLNNKLFKIFQNFSFNLVYIIICFIFLINERTNTKFYQNDAIKRQLQIEKLKQTEGTDAIWNWIMQYAVPTIFPYKEYNGQILTINKQMFLADQDNLRLGAVRFRQIRAGEGWKRENQTRDEDIRSAFRYTSSADSGEYFEQMGTLESYENGGYIIDINDRYRKAKQILLRLRSSNWLTERTRCLFICLNTYNANTGLYMQTIIQMEKLFLRDVRSVVNVISFKMYPFVDLWDYFLLLILIVFVCLTIANIVNLIRYLIKTTDPLSWTICISLLSLISSAMITIGYILRIDRLLTLRDELIANPDKYISGDALIFQENIYLSGLCGFILVVTLKLCQPLSINYYFFLMKASIMISLPYLRSFVIYLTVILSSFSYLTYLLFHQSLFSFKSLGSAYMTLFRIFLLLAKYRDTFHNNTIAMHFIFFVYTFSSAICLMNICLSILNDSFTFIKQQEIGSESKFDWELNQHLWTQLMSLFQSKQKIDTTAEKESVPFSKDHPNLFDHLDHLSSQMDKILDVTTFHLETETREMRKKCLAFSHLICQKKPAPKKPEEDIPKIEVESKKHIPNILNVIKEKNENCSWTYWYYYNDNRPLLNITFFCEEEEPGEIICRYIVEDDISSKTKNELISYTLLGPTIEFFSNGIHKTIKNEFDIVYFCLKPLPHYYCCQLLYSSTGTIWLPTSPPQMLQPGLEEHILQDVIHVKMLPTYLNLVRRSRREYLFWDNENGKKVSLLEPNLCLSLSSRDISKNTCSAILKMELEDTCCYPIVVVTLNVEIEDPITFQFQEMNASNHSSLQLYTKTRTTEWNEENQFVKDKIFFQSKLHANQEKKHLLRSSHIEWNWRNKMKCLKDPLNKEFFFELAQKIGSNWKELGKHLGISPTAMCRIQNNISEIHPEMACFEVLTQWYRFSVMTERKIQFLKSALSIMEENLSHSIDDIADKYENQCNKVIQESEKIKLFDQISRSEVMVSSWKKLAKNLGLTERDIENIDKCEVLTSREKCYNALMSWEMYNREMLRQILTEMGFSFLAGKV